MKPNELLKLAEDHGLSCYVYANNFTVICTQDDLNRLSHLIGRLDDLEELLCTAKELLSGDEAVDDKTPTRDISAALYALVETPWKHDKYTAADHVIEQAAYRLDSQTVQLNVLRDAIEKTINDNLHLAAGEVCTLIDLKRAIGYDDKFHGKHDAVPAVKLAEMNG